MTEFHSAGEVFRLAQSLERNAALFYRRCADVYPSHGPMFLRLATMEDQHADTFSKMAGRLPKEEQGQPPSAAARPQDNYFAALAAQCAMEGSSALAAVTEAESVKDILLRGIGGEKEAVVFYTSIQNDLATELGSHKVSEIIEQEMGHIVQLYVALKAVEQT